MRQLLVATLLLLPLGGSLWAQCPEEPPIQHWTGAGTTACPCFISGEVIGASFDVPAGHYPIEILRIGVGWGSVFGSSPDTLESALLIYPAGLPNPGAPQFSLGGPVMVDGFINEFDISSIPNNPGTDRIVTSGPFSVGLELANASPPFGPAPVHDGNGCTGGGSNLVFAIPGGWSDACSLGVTGDWIIQVVYRPSNCGPTDMVLTVGTLTAGQIGTFGVTNGAPLTQTYLAYSLAGTGSKFIPQLNVTLGITQPQQAGPTLFTDAGGAVTWNLPIPNNAAGRPVWIQAAQQGLISNVVATTVN